MRGNPCDNTKTLALFVRLIYRPTYGLCFWVVFGNRFWFRFPGSKPVPNIKIMMKLSKWSHLILKLFINVSKFILLHNLTVNIMS